MNNSSDQDAQAKRGISSARASKHGYQEAPVPNAKTLKAMKELEAGKGQRFSSEQEHDESAIVKLLSNV